MNPSLNNTGYTFTEQNIHLLEFLIRSSIVRYEDITEVLKNQIFNLKITRPYWENATVKKWLLISTITYVPEISSELIFSGVQNLKIIWRDKAFDKQKYHDILGLQYNPKEKIIEIDFEFFLISLKMERDFVIELKDFYETGENLLRIIGNKFPFYESWKKEYYLTTKRDKST